MANEHRELDWHRAWRAAAAIVEEPDMQKKLDRIKALYTELPRPDDKR